MTTRFETGKTYQTRSPCDSEVLIEGTVIARTDKTVTMRFRGDKTKTMRPRIFAGYDHETVRPWGSYSMCPVLGADDEVTP